MYKVKWENKAIKQLVKIGDNNDRKEIKNATQELVDFPNVKNIKKLTNHKYPYRLRVARYRIFFDNEDDIRIIHIEEVKKRDDRTY